MKTPWIFIKYILTLPLTSVKSRTGIGLDNKGNGNLKSLEKNRVFYDYVLFFPDIVYKIGT